MMMNWFEQDSWYFNQSISLAMMNGKMIDQENDMLREVNTLRGMYPAYICSRPYEYLDRTRTVGLYEYTRMV